MPKSSLSAPGQQVVLFEGQLTPLVDCEPANQTSWGHMINDSHMGHNPFWTFLQK